MRYLFVIQLITILLFHHLRTLAQPADIKWGQAIKFDGKEGSYMQLITRSQGNTCLLEQKTFEPFKLKFFVTKLDKDLNLASSKELEAESARGHDMKFMAAFYSSDKIFLFSKMTEKVAHKSMNLVYAAVFDLDGKLLDKAKVVDMAPDDKEYVFPYVCQSPDKSKLMVMSWSRKDEDGISSYNIHVLDASLDLLWGYTGISASADKVYDFKGFNQEAINRNYTSFQKNIGVDNNGRAYLLAGVKRPKSKYLAVLSYYSESKGRDLAWDATQNITSEFPIKAPEKQKLNYYDAHLMGLNNGNMLLCFGFNIEGTDDKGASYMLIDGKANALLMHSFIYNKSLEPDDDNGKERKSLAKQLYHIKYAASQPDGSLTLVFDVNNEQPDPKNMGSGYLLVLKLNPDGSSRWQKMFSASPIPGDYTIVPGKDDKLYISYTLLSKLLDKKELNTLHAKGIAKDKDNALSLCTLDKDAMLHRTILNLPAEAVVCRLLPDSKEILYYRWVSYSMQYSMGLGNMGQ